MSSKIQFIVSNGITSKEAKKAQRKLVRSHVTAQRYQRKRREEVQAYRAENPELVAVIPSIRPEIDIADILKCIETEEKGSTVPASYSTSHTYTNTDSESPVVALKSPAGQLERYSEQFSFTRMYELGPGQHEGLWLPLPYSFPSLGSPFDDPFVAMPAALSPRISKHLFYCKYKQTLETKSWIYSYCMYRCQRINATDAPKLHDKLRPEEVSLFFFSRC